MAGCRPFDDLDKQALHKLDNDFTISPDGETASITGEMTIELVRPADDGGAQFWLAITFPGGEELDVRIRRIQLLEQLNIEGDES
jgi:hypothetical protein